VQVYGQRIADAVGAAVTSALKSHGRIACRANGYKPRPCRGLDDSCMHGGRFRIRCVLDGSWWVLRRKRRTLQTRAGLVDIADIFEIEKCKQNMLSFKMERSDGGSGVYLSSDENGELSCDRPWREEWEFFTMVQHDDARVSIRNFQKRYFCLQLNGEIAATSLHISERELFALEAVDAGA
jgi:hypothetical protein